MIFYLLLVVTANIKADLFIQETRQDIKSQQDVTFRFIKTNETSPLLESNDDYSQAICPWTFTIDDNIKRIPRRIMVMDETHGLPLKCNLNNSISDNFTCEAIRRKMNVLWITESNNTKCTLEERTITVSVGLTCVQSGIHGNQERDRNNSQDSDVKKQNKEMDKRCKGETRRQCRKFCRKAKRDKKQNRMRTL